MNGHGAAGEEPGRMKQGVAGNQPGSAARIGGHWITFVIQSGHHKRQGVFQTLPFCWSLTCTQKRSLPGLPTLP
jgi:hypothetical protein